MNASSFSGFRIARVSWNRKLLFAEPPPLATNISENSSAWSTPGAAAMSNCTGRLVPVLTSSNIDSGAICE